jgi:excinuclease ABC subunit B
VDGKVLLYADVVTGSMERAIAETDRRREVQRKYNEEHGVAPSTVDKIVRETVRSYDAVKEVAAQYSEGINKDGPVRVEDIPLLIASMEKDMKDLAKAMEFEKAAEVRDEIVSLRAMLGASGGKLGLDQRKNRMMKRR